MNQADFGTTVFLFLFLFVKKAGKAICFIFFGKIKHKKRKFNKIIVHIVIDFNQFIIKYSFFRSNNILYI